jgi:hypothetical protein
VLLRPFLVADATAEIAPGTPGPAGPLMNELVKRTMEAVRKQPGKSVIEPHKANGKRLSRERNGARSAEGLRESRKHGQVGMKGYALQTPARFLTTR